MSTYNSSSSEFRELTEEALENLIKNEENLFKLNHLLCLKFERIQSGTSKRLDFSISKILNDASCPSFLKKQSLKWALLIQESSKELKIFMNWCNLQLDTFLNHNINCDDTTAQLFQIIEIFYDLGPLSLDIILHHVNLEKFTAFFMELTKVKISTDIDFVKLPSVLLYYFDEIVSKDMSSVCSLLRYLKENDCLEFLCLLFDKKINYLVKCNYLQEEEFWIYLKSHLISENSLNKKQTQYVLLKITENLKINDTNYITVLKSKTRDDWNNFFMMLEIIKEKQLHLIQPALKLLPVIGNLHIMWQMIVYKKLLNHSQILIVYEVINYLLELEFESRDDFKEIIQYVLVALNRYEYSNVSNNSFLKLKACVGKLDDSCCELLFEEIIKIQWNPATAWCLIKSIAFILFKIHRHKLQNLLNNLKALPHTFMKICCILIVLNKTFSSTEDIVQYLVQCGKFLLFNNSATDTEIFHRLVDTHRMIIISRREHLKDNILKAINEENDEHLYVLLETLRVSNIVMNFDDSIPHSNMGDIILFQQQKFIYSLKIHNYLINRIKSLEFSDCKYLIKYFNKLPYAFANELYNEKINDEYLKLWDSIKGNNFKELLVIEMMFHFSNLLTKNATHLDEWTSLICHSGLSKYENKKFLMKIFRYQRIQHFDLLKMNSLIETFHELLALEDDKLLYLAVENLDLLSGEITRSKSSDSINICEQCLNTIFQLPNNLLRSYLMLFFKSIFKTDLFCNEDFSKAFECWYNNLFSSYIVENEILFKVIMEGCRSLILNQVPHVDIFVPLICSALECGIIIQKNYRVEYGVCQDIMEYLGELKSIQNPNIVRMELKMLAMESLYLLARNDSLNNLTADKLLETLLNMYRIHYKKRYFPDSKIHIEKLRIVQAMLITIHLVKESRNHLIQFVLDSFIEESHQSSVKQLLQWVLMILVSSDMQYFNEILKLLTISNSPHSSTVIALIPVTYQLTVSSCDIGVWYEVTKVLLPWTMGANFKLRVYSQVTLKALLHKAKQNGMSEYYEKYSQLDKCFSEVLEVTGKSVEETLKTDLSLIENFDPHTYFSVENIFINLPKLHNVPNYEWENVHKYKFSNDFDIPITSDYKFPDRLQSEGHEKEKYTEEYSGFNVQKKIIPWKSIFEENNEEMAFGGLICVASLLEKPSNLGGLSRSCEVFGTKQLVVHNGKIRDDKEFQNLSMSSENWVDIIEVKKDNMTDFFISMKGRGYSLVGLEQTSQSTKLNVHKFDKKTVLVLGNEKEGIPAPLLPFMDICVEIPQFGQTRSLNVHVAAATFMWEYVKQIFLKEGL